MSTDLSVLNKAILGVSLIVTSLLMLFWLATPAQASTFTVSNFDDSGAGSLRQAITDANSGSGSDTVVFQSGLSGTIMLNSQLPTISDTAGLTIDGESADITVSGDDSVRVFEVGSGAGLSLKNLTVAEGAGGAGAGILNRGTLTVTNSTFSGNNAPATSAGGGIANLGTLTVTNSTFSGNTAGDGGGIFTNSLQQLTVTNSTFSGNSAVFRGGGIFTSASPATLRNTIVANSPSGGTCDGTITDGGYNLDDGTTCGFSTANNSQPSTNPLLGPLADNGGPTQTHALLTGSLAIDKGDSSIATTDQRGESRPHDFANIPNATGGDGSDVGAYEEQAPPNRPPVAVDDPNAQTLEDNPVTVAVLQNDTDPDGLSDLDPSSVEVVSQPSNGTATPDILGDITYTPNPDFNGEDTFTYKLKDGAGAESNQATVTIQVNAVNDAPTLTVAAGGSCGSNDRSGRINLSVADVDNPLASLTLNASSSNPALLPNSNVLFGSTTNPPGAARTLSATAVSGKTGTAVLSVRVSDGQATSTPPLTVNVRVGGNGVDNLGGTSGTDMLFGQNGNDRLNGMGAKDLLCGGRGDDRLTGGLEADHFSGGQGTDTATDFSLAQGDSRDNTIP